MCITSPLPAWYFWKFILPSLRSFSEPTEPLASLPYLYGILKTQLRNSHLSFPPRLETWQRTNLQVLRVLSMCEITPLSPAAQWEWGSWPWTSTWEWIWDSELDKNQRRHQYTSVIPVGKRCLLMALPGLPASQRSHWDTNSGASREELFLCFSMKDT